MSSAPRKQAARLPRPAARYWKGKVPKGADALASDSDESDDEQQVQEGEEGDVMIGGDEDEEDEEELEVREVQKVGAKKGMNVSLKDVSVSKEGRVTVAGKDEVGRTLAEQEEEEEEEEEAEEEEESSEEESSEEESEDEPPKPQFRPVFVPKRGRATIAEKEQLAQDTEEAQKKKELDAEERKKQSHDLVAESIKRELLEKEKEEIVPDIDDTDGLDPEGEFEAWRLRELARIKRDKEEELRRELEREEVERRRALPEEQRMKEDLEHAEQLRAEKPKGQQKFLQKYWHKGAFHQDEDILKRDYTEATASTMDVSLLPKVMQVKNFGKRSRTKYTHLLDQDTTGSASNFGGAANGAASGASTSGSGCFLCGGPHMKKDCPQNENLPPGKRPESNWQGNKRQDFGWQDRKQDSGWQSRPQKGPDRERPRSRSPPPVSRPDDRRERDRDNGRDWRRSRSPRRYDNRRRDDQRYKERRRSRSRSVEHDRDRDDKRRKIAG